ncbi:MAG: hypothetical protein Q9198_010851 [Flavoplaca austrocitrina]
MQKIVRSKPLAAAWKGLQQAPARRPFQQQKRFLSIHEYLSANLLKTYGIGVPKGEVARSAAEAETIAKQIGTDNLLNHFRGIDRGIRRR